MHPILRRPGRLVLYLAAWVPVAALLGVFLIRAGGMSLLRANALATPMALAMAFLALAAWYPCRALPPWRAPLVRILLAAAVGAVVTSGLWIAAGGLWVFLLDRVPALAGIAAGYWTQAPLLFALGELLYVFVVAVHYLGMSVDETQEAARRALELRALAREAELRALRAQIDPHFLFNSLNSVSALIPSEPAAARAMCLQLAEFLRATLAIGGCERVPLARELALVRSFLAVERTRFGPRLAVDEALDAGADACAVPPLLLQPLIENAVRHGISQRLEGGTVRIEAARRGDRLALAVENPCDAERPRPAGSSGGGLGLANVRARLRSLYGAEGRVEVTERDGRFRVELSLPAEAAPR